jgi:hypothetical protein
VRNKNLNIVSTSQSKLLGRTIEPEILPEILEHHQKQLSLISAGKKRQYMSQG